MDAPRRGASNYLRPSHAVLALPRVGYDRLDFTSGVQRPLPALLGEYQRTGDKWLTTSTYRRKASYRHTSDAAAPILDVLYDPRLPFRPTLRVRFRATMVHLLDLETIARALQALRPYIAAPVLCELELTLDFPVRRAAELRRLYVPRARAYETREQWRWWCVGSRTSAMSIRGYEKHEAEMSTARIEVTARRAALKRLHVTGLGGLIEIDWWSVLASRLRFVELDPGRCDAETYGRLTREFAARGVNATLRSLPRAERERIKRRWQPARIGRDVRRLVRAFRPRVSDAVVNDSPRVGRPAGRLVYVDAIP